MEPADVGTSDVSVGKRDAIDTRSKAYEAARDRGDTLEAARAILQKIGLLNGNSLTRETTRSSRDNEGARFLQHIADLVGDHELSPEDVIQNMLETVSDSGSADSETLDFFLQDWLSLDVDGFKDALESDREALEKQIEAGVRMSSTQSNSQAIGLKDLLYQRDVLLSLDGELTDMIKGLKSTLNDRG